MLTGSRGSFSSRFPFSPLFCEQISSPMALPSVLSLILLVLAAVTAISEPGAVLILSSCSFSPACQWFSG